MKHANPMFWTLHLNIQSVSQNGSRFNVWLSALSIKFSVIGITQTWLNKTEYMADIEVYNFTHKHRESGLG